MEAVESAGPRPLNLILFIGPTEPEVVELQFILLGAHCRNSL